MPRPLTGGPVADPEAETTAREPAASKPPRYVIRAEDNNEPLLDNDGQPIAELTLDSADHINQADATLAELAAAQRSWRYGHVIVDEAQDLTPMQWRMVARRARGGAMTIVGDLAQRASADASRSAEPTEVSWHDLLPASLADFDYQELSVNYRSPSEINDLAGALLAQLAPQLQSAVSIRHAGVDPKAVSTTDLAQGLATVLAEEIAAVPRGRIGVIRAESAIAGHAADIAADPDNHHPVVTDLTARQSKGLEFDSVIIVEPAAIAALPSGLSLLFVALTRSTSRLTLLHRQPLPAVLESQLTQTSPSHNS